MNLDEPQLTISKNHLPRWWMDDSIYFITWRLHSAQSPLHATERSLIASALKYFHSKRYTLLAYVVMDDHVHVLVKPHKDNTLSEILHSWKSFTANRIQRKSRRDGAIWQKDSHTHIIRDERDLYAKMEYIMNNPQKRWPDVVGYQWAELLL